MQIIEKGFRFDFMARRRGAVAVSLVLMAMAIGSLATRGLELGVEFTGGQLVEVRYPAAVELDAVRSVLAEAGYGGAQVQHFGSSSDVLIRLAAEVVDESSEDAARVSDQVLGSLQADTEGVELLDSYFVGSQVGEELTEQGGLAMLFALGMILMYIWFRFELKFSLGAIAALAHDTLLVIGFFSVTGAGFDLSVLAAVLAVIGYSLNDTIVVFDRIRENFTTMRKVGAVEVINTAVNQMLPRTMITSLTTLLVLTSLFLLGGEVIHGFATALIVGVVVGTYSSIFVAAPVALAMGASREDFMVPRDDEMPESLP